MRKILFVFMEDVLSSKENSMLLESLVSRALLWLGPKGSFLERKATCLLLIGSFLWAYKKEKEACTIFEEGGIGVVQLLLGCSQTERSFRKIMSDTLCLILSVLHSTFPKLFSLLLEF